MTLNKMMMIGYVGADPVFRLLEGGNSYASLRLATSESSTDKNGQKEMRTEWHTIVFWRVQAEQVHKYIRKGSLLYVEGKLRHRSWDDQQGTKHYVSEIYADQFRMLGRREEEKIEGEPDAAQELVSEDNP